MKTVIFLFLMFFTLTSADRKPAETPAIILKPVTVKSKPFIIHVSDNNLYNKAQAKILLYKIKIAEERDTIKEIIKDHDSIVKTKKK